MKTWTSENLNEIIKNNPVVVFGKGTKTNPQCGFTLRAIKILEQHLQDFIVINIFEDPAIKELLVEHTGWPTTPQIFISGEFIGGSDILLEMYNSGELSNKIPSAE